MPEQKIKILFVDDDNFLRRVYDSELSEQNYDVILAVDGQDGLDKAHSEDPDLIILDMIMPKKNGFEVLSELQRDPVTSHIPVIILSNLGQEADKQKGMDLGAVDYLVKDSTTLGAIITKIEHILHSRTRSKEVQFKSHQAAIKDAKSKDILESKEKIPITPPAEMARQILKKVQPVAASKPKESIKADGKEFHFCPECGDDLKNNYKFCPSCGYKLE